MAKFGQLYLQKGMWNGQQILPAEWVEQATTKQVSNGDNPESDWNQGYCFQFWRCRHNAFRGDGAYSQFVVVIPDKDVVIASTADSNRYQDILNYYWNLLPEMQDTPLAENADTQKRLQEAENGKIAKNGESGSFIDQERVIESKILGKEMKYNVYLPAGYRTTGYYYPVLYLLHGLGDNENAWPNPKQGNLKEIADNWFKDRQFDKMIIVMPDAERTWYMNKIDGKYQYEDYFFNELMPQVEKIYRIRAEKKYRAIAGLSMGGHGSLLYSLHHPDMFQTCYAMSAAVRTPEEMRAMPFDQYQNRFQTPFGEMDPNAERLNDFVLNNLVCHLIQKYAENNKDAVRFTLDCGDDDSLLSGNYALFSEMKKLGVPCELRVRDGEHRWDYWRMILPDAFEFISAGFRD